MSKRSADKLRSAYAIMIRLSGAGVENLPSSETQCRELSRVQEDKVCDAWACVLDAGCEQTASSVREALIDGKFVAPRSAAKPPADQFRTAIQAALDKLPARDRKAMLAKSLSDIVDS